MKGVRATSASTVKYYLLYPLVSYALIPVWNIGEPRVVPVPRQYRNDRLAFTPQDYSDRVMIKRHPYRFFRRPNRHHHYP